MALYKTPSLVDEGRDAQGRGGPEDMRELHLAIV